MYRLHRVFCATSWELEGERRAFHDVIADANESEAMARGVLWVPVTLANIRDKRPLQYAIEENIRDSSFYLLVLTEGWGPAERNFARDYKLALACVADPKLPMRETAFLWQTSSDGGAMPAGLPPPTAEFSTTDEFKSLVRARLSAWLTAAIA